MKKLYLVFVFVLVLFTAACTPEGSGNYLVLPDLNGKTVDEITEKFDGLNQNYVIEYEETENELYENQFIMYVNYDTGDIVNNDDEVIVLVYPEFTGERTLIRLPDLSGFSKNEILAYFSDLGVSVSFSETVEFNEESAGMFKEYGSLYEIGDVFYLTSAVSVVIYQEYVDNSMYFFPIEMEYDGPYLSDIYETIDPIDPRGGYFDVTLKYCTDGDTGVFNYPQEIYDAIYSSSKSTRFLNMDTEETFSGGEEEWGKPGSVFTCELLTSAESIRLQTDPGDALTGTYGRLLAWVWIKLPGEEEYFLLNYMVVKQGLAQVKYEYGAGLELQYGAYTYNQWMHIAENYAIENELGQWGDKLDYYWDYQNDQPLYERWH